MKHSLTDNSGNHLGNEYTLNLNIKIDDDIYFIQSSFVEEGTTGIRDSSVLGMLANEYGSIIEVWNIWSRDPYDNTFDKGFLMNKSEDVKYDEMFPNHPLSKAREFVNYIINNN